MLFYLATPYTLYPKGIEAAYRLACENAAILVRGGVAVFSPIAHTHGVAVHGGIDPKDHQFWLAADAPLMRVCDALIVLKGEGWHESKGVMREIGTFRRMGKQVFWMDPGNPRLTTSSRTPRLSSAENGR